MNSENILKVLKILNKKYPDLPIKKVGTNPFKILVATLLSQRARDDQIIPVAKKLFSKASTPQKMLSLNDENLQKIIKPAGKYRQNAERIKKISKLLISKFDGKVPSSEKDLLSLPGVGRKTANIVLSQAFGKDAIAVDTHVHRITNRLGWIKTKTPAETEEKLKNIIPKRYWKIVNRIFVRHGQEICKPQSPFCSRCPIENFCKQVGVHRLR